MPLTSPPAEIPMPLAEGRSAGPSSRVLIPALSFANFAIGIGAFGVIGVITPIASGLAMTHAEAGMVMSVYAIAYAVLSPLCIAASGRLNRRTVLLAGMSVFLLAAILAALAPNSGVLWVARALSAIGAGLVTPVAAAVAIARSAPDQRGAALAAVFLGLTIAQAAGIPLGSFLGYSAGWRALFWMVAASALVALAGLYWCVPPIRTPATTLASLGRTIVTLRLMLAVLITASMMAAAWILFTFFAPLLEDRMGYGRNGVTVILVIYGGGAVLGNMLGGWLTDRIGPGRALLLVGAAQILVLPLFSLLPVADAALAILAFLWGAVGWAFMVPQQTRLVSLAPERQNVTLALNASAIYLGAAVGSAAGAGIVAAFGFGALGLLAALAAVAALAHLLLSLALESKPRINAAG